VGMKPTPNAFLLTHCLLLRLLVAACFLPLWVLADNWPQWRGPAGTGVSAEKNLPLHWGTNENVRWRVPLPERGNSTPIVWGKRASPIIHGDLCILNFGPGERTFLIAVSKKTGETVWQVDEPGGDSGREKPGEKPNWVGSWSTPIVIKVNGREELIMTWPKRVAAYDPKAGKELWTCGGLNPLIYTSPLYSDGTIVAMGGFMGMALAVKADGRGDVTQTRRLWHHPKTKQRIGSGVIHHGHIYILNDPGVAECYELKSGKLVWEERHSGRGPDNSSWSSMVLADGRLYVINHSGDTFVLKATPKFELLSTNS